MRTLGQKKILKAGAVIFIIVLVLNLMARFEIINVNPELLDAYIGALIILRLASARWVSQEAKLLGQNQWVWSIITFLSPVLGMIIFGSVSFLSMSQNQDDIDKSEMYNLTKTMVVSENEINQIQKNQNLLKAAIHTEILDSSDSQEKLIQMNMKLDDLKETFNKASIRRNAILNLNIPLNELKKLYRQKLLNHSEYDLRRSELINKEIESHD